MCKILEKYLRSCNFVQVNISCKFTLARLSRSLKFLAESCITLQVNLFTECLGRITSVLLQEQLGTLHFLHKGTCNDIKKNLACMQENIYFPLKAVEILEGNANHFNDAIIMQP